MSIIQWKNHSLFKYIPIKFLKSFKELQSTIMCGGKLFKVVEICKGLHWVLAACSYVFEVVPLKEDLDDWWM